jgi:hypothetical protein
MFIKELLMADFTDRVVIDALTDDISMMVVQLFLICYLSNQLDVCLILRIFLLFIGGFFSFI